MKKLIILFILGLAAGVASASTTVSGTATDSDGQAWIGGTWSATVSPGGTAAFSGVLDGTGSFSQAMTTGLTYYITICPQASAGCGTAVVFTTGSTQSVTTQIAAVIHAPRFVPIPGSFGYNDTEATGSRPYPQATYCNIINQVTRVYNGGWLNGGACASSGGGGAVSSVFGRTGAVAATSGDYSFSLISGAASLTTQVSGILPLANGGTATATPALVAGTNITITGTWPNQTINSSGGSGITGLTTGYFPEATSSTSIGNSPVDDGVTTAATITSTETISAPSLQATGGCPGATSGGCYQATEVVGTPTGVGGNGIFYFTTGHLPFVILNAGSPVQLITTGGGINGSNQVTSTALSAPLPVAQGGTALASGTSGGILGYTATGTLASSAALTAGVLVEGGGAGATPTNSLATDNGTTLAYTGTGGDTAKSFTSTGASAGFADFPQGSTSSAVAPCNAATSICEQAPTTVVSYLVNKPGAAANGVYTNNNASNVITQGISGDANHSTTVTISSATSVGSTSLCSTTNCPAGTYQLTAYIDVTAACTTTGTYFVDVIYTDDQGAKTVVVPLQGLGVTTTYGPTAITSSLGLASTSNYAQGTFILRSTGAASINYSTTAGACGTGGPAAGKLYLTVFPVQ